VKQRTLLTRAALGSISPAHGFGKGLAALDLDGDQRRELVLTDPAAIVFSTTRDVNTVFIGPSGALNSMATHTSFNTLYGLGHSAASVGDRNGDGIPDLAVGDPFANAGFFSLVGKVWLFFMRTDGSVQSSLQIGPGSGGFNGLVGEDDKFGLAITELADLDGNGVTDLAVGVNDNWRFPAYFAPGAVWLLFMEPGGTVSSEKFIAPGVSGFVGPLATRDHFGEGLAWTERGSTTGVGTLWVGAHGDDVTGNEEGAVWRLTLDGVANPPAVVVENGSHVNPLVLTSTSLPRVDATWTASVDASVHPGATSTFLVAYEDSAQVLLAIGELLVLIGPLGTNLFVDTAPVIGGVGRHAIPIPNTPSLVGWELHVQGLLAGGGPLLTNALELAIGAP